VKQGLTKAQRLRLERLREAGAELYSLPPPEPVKANAGDMVCIDEGTVTNQFIVVSRNGAVFQRVTVMHHEGEDKMIRPIEEGETPTLGCKCGKQYIEIPHSGKVTEEFLEHRCKCGGLTLNSYAITNRPAKQQKRT
jgi:hypothetical protein